MSAYTLYHGDCLDILPTLEAGSVDAVIADIPSGRTACAWDSVIPFDAMWSNLKRVAKRHAVIVLLGCTQPFTSALVMSNPKMFKYDWVWDKVNPSGFQIAKHRPMMQHESILVFGDSLSYYPIKTPRTKVKKSRHYGNSSDSSPLAHVNTDVYTYTDYYPKSILSVSNANRTSRIHPTQKPLALLEYLVKTYSNEGDVILDFTMGSGTTGHACGNLGRRFIGIEKDECYYGIAAERIATAYEPLRMMAI